MCSGGDRLSVPGSQAGQDEDPAQRDVLVRERQVLQVRRERKAPFFSQNSVRLTEPGWREFSASGQQFLLKGGGSPASCFRSRAAPLPAVAARPLAPGVVAWAEVGTAMSQLGLPHKLPEAPWPRRAHSPGPFILAIRSPPGPGAFRPGSRLSSLHAPEPVTSEPSPAGPEGSGVPHAPHRPRLGG